MDGSFFYMYGGSITDNSANNGGGVAGRVSNYKVNGGYVVGRLLMLGGTITGNKAAANGGGVDMDCAFEMCGGSITSNEADANGGGVAVKGDHSVEWSGGSVTGNTAKNNGPFPGESVPRCCQQQRRPDPFKNGTGRFKGLYPDPADPFRRPAGLPAACAG